MRSLDKLMNMALRNKGLKLAALVLAVLTWYYIRDITSFEEQISDIPLQITVPDGTAIKELSTPTVTVRFRGSEADLRNLDKTQIRVQKQVRPEISDQNPVLELRPADVSSPRAVRAIAVSPSEVKVTLDREKSKTVRVEVTMLGELPEGYVMEDFRWSPEEVTILGPEQALKEIELVRTTPLDLSGRIRSFSDNVALTAPPGLPMARMLDQQIRVSFTVRENIATRLFKDVPVKILVPPGSPADFTLSPDKVDVELSGRVNVLSNLASESVYAFVDYTSINTPEEVSGLAVEVTTPARGLGVLRVEPAAVRLNRKSNGGP